MRLDAVACWLQDVAYADVHDAGLESVAVWVVRRTRIHVRRFPRFGEHFTLTTFCTGLGRMWAERGTEIARADGDGPDVEVSSLWVHLDADRWVPSPLTQAEITAYGGTERAPKVSARLRHSPPPASAGGMTWTFRATECDIADHINNAAYWAPLEEELLGRADEPEGIDVELEYRAPTQPGRARVIAQEGRRWIVGEDGVCCASLALLR